MRRILSEDSVSSEASRGTGSRSRMPESGVYIPNYRGVNQSLSTPGGSGQISFMNALAQMGSRNMAEQQELYDNMEVAQTLAKVDTQYRQDSEQFLQENATGKGYTEYITGKYNDATTLALSNTSNGNVRNKLQLLFERRKFDVANNAFQREKEIYTGYALNETQSMLNATLNEVILAPSEVQSLSAKYDQQVMNMRNILPADKFEAYRKGQLEEFLFSYGLGLIREKPYEAVDLVKGKEFVTGLSPDRFNKLQRHAEAEIEHRERKAKEYQSMLEAAQRKESTRENEEVKYGIATHTIVSEEEITTNSKLTNGMKVERLSQLRTEKKRMEEEFAISTGITDVINKEAELSSIANVSAEKRNRYLGKYFQEEDEKRVAAGGKPLSLVEKVKFCEDNQSVFASNYNPLKIEIVDTIKRTSGDNAKLLEGCIALAGEENIPVLKGIDRDVIDFAHLAVDTFKGSKDLSGLNQLRDDYFNTAKDQEEMNRGRWKALYPRQDRKEILQEFYRENGYDKGFFKLKILESPDIQLIDNKVYPVLQRVFMKTGSLTKAHASAAHMLQEHLIYNKKKGTYELNPPRPENTGLSQTKLNSEIDKAKTFALSKAKGTGLVKEGIMPDEIYFESVNWSEPRYSFYYLQDKDDPTSREYLYNSKGKKIIYDFRE